MPTTFANSIDSNPIYAARAENDKDGNRIDQTYAKSASLATVATTGDYNDLSNKPSIPSAQVNSDWNSTSGVSEILNKPTLATVATSGSYTDLSNKPTIPSVDQSYNAASTNAQSGVAVAQAIAAIPSTSYTAGDGIDITANEVSVKAGTGLEIADVSETTTDNLVCAAMSSNWAYDVCPMTQALADAMNTSSGYIFTLVKPFDTYNVYAWPAIAKTSELLQGELQNYAFFGNYLSCRPSTDGSDYPYEVSTGTQLTLKFSERDQLSTVTVADILGDLSNYSLTLLWYDEDYPSAAATMLSSSMTPETTATHTTTTTLQDALCVSNPLPASTVSDANKVLKVNASGEPEWATGGGGGGTQADWAEADPLEPSYIENKPVPKTLVAGTNITISENSSTLTVSATWQNAQADWTETDPNEPAYVQHKPNLATVATSGDYTDLSNTPTVDHTYDSSSANAQSGVAVAEAISAAVIPISIVSALPADPDPNTLYVVTGA